MSETFLNLPLLKLIDFVGCFAFALSGCIVAVRKDFDLTGSLIMAGVTAVGGGFMRDVIIQNGQPYVFTHSYLLLAPIFATFTVFFLYNQVFRQTRALIYTDALGLALYCVVGTLKARQAGISVVGSIILGVLTAVGGGVLRDLLASRKPAIFDHAEIYAIPAFFGSLIIALCDKGGVLSFPIIIAVMISVFSARIVSWEKQLRFIHSKKS